MKVAAFEPVHYPCHKGLYQALAERCELTLFYDRLDKERFPLDEIAPNHACFTLETIKLPRLGRHPAGYREEFPLLIPLSHLWHLLRLEPDVVVTSQMGLRTLLIWVYCGLTDRPMVIYTGMSERTEKGRGLLRTLVRKYLVKQNTLIVHNGESGRRYLLSLGANPEILRRQPYVANASSIYQGECRRGPVHSRRLLYVGRLNARKGILKFTEILSAWCRRMPDYSVELTLVGEGPHRGILQESRYAPNLKVTLRGARSQEQLPQEYAEHGALVFPTLGDEWGLVVNEALHSGLPVIGSIHSQAVTELVTHGQNGWLFDPESEEQTGSALEAFFLTPSFRLEQMRVWARESVAELTSECIARQAFSYICEAVERHRSSKTRFSGY